jgi:hypothetical protein
MPRARWGISGSAGDGGIHGVDLLKTNVTKESVGGAHWARE